MSFIRSPFEKKPQSSDDKAPLAEDQIRLLRFWEARRSTEYALFIATDHRLKSAQGKDTELAHELDQVAPKYEVLIYSSNRSEATQTIRCSSSAHSFSSAIDVKISSKLLKEVRSLGAGSDYLDFWIESVCVNLRDHTQEASQDSKLARIYENAENICVWVGEDTKDSDLAFDFIHCLNAEPFDHLFVDIAKPFQWLAFLSLMERPWFDDIPFLQHRRATKHATVRCGSREIAWSYFVRAVKVFTSRFVEINDWFNQEYSR
jgi:hypothetical protein